MVTKEILKLQEYEQLHRKLNRRREFISFVSSSNKQLVEHQHYIVPMMRGLMTIAVHSIREFYKMISVT